MAAVAMTGEQLTEILSNMQNSMMDALQKVINNDTATASVAASAAATAQEQSNLNTKTERKEFTPKFDPKSFARLEKFSGGDAAWKEFSIRFLMVFCPNRVRLNSKGLHGHRTHRIDRMSNDHHAWIIRSHFGSSPVQGHGSPWAYIFLARLMILSVAILAQVHNRMCR